MTNSLPVDGFTMLRITRERMLSFSSILRTKQQNGLFLSGSEKNTEYNNEALNSEVASQFSILVCSSTTCSKRSSTCGLQEYEVLSGLYERKEGAGASAVTVKESGCLGRCGSGPCIGVEHEDFFGNVALDGMKPNEFNDCVFHRVVSETDMDRVWTTVENAIIIMSEEEE